MKEGTITFNYASSVNIGDTVYVIVKDRGGNKQVEQRILTGFLIFKGNAECMLRGVNNPTGLPFYWKVQDVYETQESALKALQIGEAIT